MAIPQTWEELLNGPVYVINMDRDSERLITCKERLSKAGFKNINRWKAVDGRMDNISEEWAKHGSPLFDPSDTRFLDIKGSPFKQGTLLSYLALWKNIIDNNIPWLTIFEDDIVFHATWNELAPIYFNATPKDFGLLYMGHHFGYNDIIHKILKIPVYCTHAHVITLDGAKELYKRFLSEPSGVRTIDCMINYFMGSSLISPSAKPFINWYVWNASMFPDNTASKHPQHAHKDMGLVFQEYIKERSLH
jgi:GR25 family glycosyltransferase involved in LPS biosynthesis